MSPDPDWDHYYIPGTHVLRNKLGDAAHPDGITNAVILDRIESGTSVIRMAELLAAPVADEVRFDLDYAEAIHRHLFSDVYPFAGEIRTGPRDGMVMTKHGTDVVDYAPGDPNAPLRAYFHAPIAELRDGGANHAYDIIEQLDSFRHLDHDQYVTALATVWGGVNYEHIFREGNTRTQAVFFTQLAERGGHDLDLTRFSYTGDLRTEFIDARNHNLATMATDRLEAVIDKVLTPIPDSGLDRSPTIGTLLAATRSVPAPATIRPVSLRPTAPAPEADLGRDTGHDTGL